MRKAKMRHKHLIVPVSVLMILLVSVAATASIVIPAADKAKENAKAPENSPVIDERWGLERVDFIHYARPENPGKGQKAATCYKLLGVKWKTLPVSYVINPSNPYNMSEGFVTGAVSASAETWDAATSAELFNDAYSVDYSADYGVQNFVNALAFGDYPDSGVIAVTSVWYTPVGKRIVEFDMLFNTRFAWGDATANPAVMDLQNIATHELGHAAGLDDIYSTSCSAVTMYGYSSYGEMSKRTLEQPDVTGLQRMYGP
ncbi:matrixin family metalloprotease [Candidatus Woesearchaeota archaeon]|nr:matrixin family metalloprotease [Candidatus Woesearchaeota archaeon]